MVSNYLYHIPTILIVTVLLILIVISFWIGIIITKKKNSVVNNDFGPVEGALLSLLALLLSFTFSATYSKYNERRKVIIEEANAIGTAILRIGLYPDSVKQLLKEDFKEYVSARIEYYNAKMDDSLVQQANAKTEKQYTIIWNRLTAMSKTPNSLIFTNQMVPAVNNMIDIVTTRDDLTKSVVPASIKWVLLLLILVSSFIIGTHADNITKNKMINLGFAVMICMTCYLILDLDRPHMGLITVDAAEKKIEDLQAMLK